MSLSADLGESVWEYEIIIYKKANLYFLLLMYKMFQ